MDILKYKKEMIDYINSLDAKQLEEAIIKAGAKKGKMKNINLEIVSLISNNKK